MLQYLFTYYEFFFAPGNGMEPNLPENGNSWFSKPIVEAGQANCV